MQEGIEPTVSTIPLGCTNKIVSGDRPSTASSDQTKHTISFSSKYDWIPCGVIATVSNHSLPYSSVIRFDRVMYSSDTSSFTLSRGLVLPFWSLKLISIPDTSAVYIRYSGITWLLVSSQPSTELCRWLAGVNQRITLPLFYTVIILQIISSSLIVTGPLYHNQSRMSSVYVIYFYFFCSVSYWPTPYYTTLFLFVKRGREVVPVGVDV